MREFCVSLKENSQLKQYLLSETDWENVEQLLLILKPFYVYSTRLQSESTTLSDFYGFWTHIIIKINKIPDSELRQKILDEMKTREMMLLSNPIIISAVFLDPRYQCLLDDDQKNLAFFF